MQPQNYEQKKRELETIELILKTLKLLNEEQPLIGDMQNKHRWEYSVKNLTAAVVRLGRIGSVI